MYKNTCAFYEIEMLDEVGDESDEESQENIDKDKSNRWAVGGAEEKLIKLSEGSKTLRGRNLEKNDNISKSGMSQQRFQRQVGSNVKFETDVFANLEDPVESSFTPIFVDPTDFYNDLDIKQEPGSLREEPHDDFEDFLEKSSKVDEHSCAYDEVQANLQCELNELSQDPTDIKKEDGYSSSEDEDDFEFIPPPKKRKRNPSKAPQKQEPVKSTKIRPPKAPEIPSNMEEVLQDPTRLPGGFKRGRYKVRSLTGVPYCKFCDTIFMNRKEKQAHVCQYLQCSDPKNYLCRICKKELSKQSFSSHYHDAAGCQYCQKKFLNPRDIKEHIENAHKGEEYKPPVITNSEVDEYVQRKLKEEGHLYEERAKILARNLEHTGPKVFTCTQCGESFRNPRSLARHERIHSDREKFPCEYCGAVRFSKSNLLKHHQWVHKIPKLRENKKRSKVTVESNVDVIEEAVTPADGNSTEQPKRSKRGRKPTKKFNIEVESSPEPSPEPLPSPPQNYDDFIEYDSECLDNAEEVIDEEFIEDFTQESFDTPKPPITKIKSYINAPSNSLLPGNIKPGRYKIRSCTGVPFCKFCDTIFANRKEKQAHECEFLKCDPKNYICRVCKKELSRQSFSSHMHETAGCQYCGKKILNPKDMKSHIAAKHKFEKYKPPLKIDDSVVEKYIQEKIEQEAHVYKLREQKAPKGKIKGKRRKSFEYFCDLCGEQEETKKSLEIHISSHIWRIYTCGQCDETFETKSAYKHHRLQHNVEITTYKCDFCSKNFNSKENIRTHQKNIHGYGLKCEVCRMAVDNKDELIAHMRNEHGNCPPCKFCGKIFLIPSKLKAHEIRHMVQSESKPSSKSYICTFCQEAFYNSTALNYHLRFHGACEQLFCEFCGKNFPTAVNLKVHQARKHQVGISCEICKEPMESKAELKEHMETHGSFNCEICSKSFIGPSKLKAHFRTHTKTEEEGNRVECNFCPKKFLPNRIRNHMFKFHNEKFDDWLASNNS